MMNSNVQAAMPKFAGLSHVCIFVDDMMEAVDYYQKLLGVVPDHYLSHWRNEGFFKAGGFVKEAADGDVSIAFVNVPGTKLTLHFNIIRMKIMHDQSLIFTKGYAVI